MKKRKCRRIESRRRNSKLKTSRRVEGRKQLSTLFAKGRVFPDIAFCSEALGLSADRGGLGPEKGSPWGYACRHHNRTGPTRQFSQISFLGFSAEGGDRVNQRRQYRAAEVRGAREFPGGARGKLHPENTGHALTCSDLDLVLQSQIVGRKTLSVGFARIPGFGSPFWGSSRHGEEKGSKNSAAGVKFWSRESNHIL